MGKSPQMEINSDKRVKESSDSFYSSRADMNFQIAVALAGLLDPKQARGGIRPQTGSSPCCAETVSSSKLKLSDFYYILIGFHFEYKPVPWDIHSCHGNAIVEECLV